jgi:tetratricopeptide (TPR) repeat protein
MRISTLVLATGLALCFAASAQGQTRFQQDYSYKGEIWHDQVDVFTGPSFGRCGDPNPRVAIPACTRALVPAGEPLSARLRVWIYAFRARAYAKRGDLDEALEDYDRAIRGASTEDQPSMLTMRAGDYALAGRTAEALTAFDEAVTLHPDSPVLLSGRAWLLATSPDDSIRDGAKAVADTLKAIELSDNTDAGLADTLAAAYAESGAFENAIEEQEKAIDLLPVNAHDAVEDFQSRLELYQQGMPYRYEPNDDES